MSPDELEKYIHVMRTHNVTVFKTGDVHLELGPAPAGPPDRRDPDAVPLPPKKSEYEKLLFAATEGFPEGEDE